MNDQHFEDCSDGTMDHPLYNSIHKGSLITTDHISQDLQDTYTGQTKRPAFQITTFSLVFYTFYTPHSTCSGIT